MSKREYEALAAQAPAAVGGEDLDRIAKAQDAAIAKVASELAADSEAPSIGDS